VKSALAARAHTRENARRPGVERTAANRQRKGKSMKQRKFSFVLSGVFAPLLLGAAIQAAAAPSELKGADILNHACGKVAVKQMGLLHDGKFEEANKLSTKDMQERWKSMPAKDREMMSMMAKELSETEAQYAAGIKAYGVLVIDGDGGKLTVQKKVQDANGSSTTTTTQEFKIAGNECLVGR